MPNDRVLGDPNGALDLSNVQQVYLRDLAAPSPGACVAASLGYFTGALKGQGVSSAATGSGAATVEAPLIATQGGGVLPGDSFVSLWFSKAAVSNWAALPRPCRGAGAPGALLFADLVRDRQLRTGTAGWPTGMIGGAFLQLWPDEPAYHAVKDGTGANTFGHSCVFRSYVAGDASSIVVSDQEGLRRTIKYPYLNLRYVIAGNLSMARLV